MKKINYVKGLLTAILFMCASASLAYDFEVDGIYYNKSGSEATVTYESSSYNSYSGIVVIPETVYYDGTTYKVVGIGGYAFRGSTELTQVIIPESVTSIADYAFYQCSSLTQVIIPEGVTYVKPYTFAYCSSLSNVTIPEGVIEINKYAFWNCETLTEIVLPESLTTIGADAFGSCSSLKEITIPNSVTLIYTSVFYNCTSLVQVTLSNNVESISDELFYGCSALPSITLPESVTSFGKKAFQNCTALSEIIIPDGVTTIGEYAFRDCTGLTELTIPDNVTEMGMRAFEGCTGLTKVTIGESVTEIGYEVFSGCTALTEVIIPNSVTEIGYCAFSGCTSMTKVTIGENVTEIGYCAFSGCTSMTKVTIGESVTRIGSYAFKNCTSLIEVTIPESVTSIGDAAFFNCTGLTSVAIPESVTEMGSSVFKNCSALTQANIPNGITTISDQLFSGCSALKEISIPAGVTEIDSYAFKDCSSLTEITIPDGVTEIGYEVFNGCRKLKSICSLNPEPPTCGSYYAGVFNNVDKNTCVLYVPEGSKTSYSSAYAWKDFNNVIETSFEVDGIRYNVSSYSERTCEVTYKSDYYSGSVEIPSTIEMGSITLTVSSIGDDAFLDCSELTEVTIPESITTIGNNSFSGCTGLKCVITLSTEPPTCVSSVFSNVDTSTCVLYVPDGAVEAYATAEQWKEFLNIMETSFEVDGIQYNVTSYSDRTCEVTYKSNAYNSYSGDIEIPASVDWGNVTFAVISIGSSAFYGCTGLTSITIPESIAGINTSAFYGCTALTEVTIPESVTEIGRSAFYGCTGLKKITSLNPEPPTCDSQVFYGVSKSACILYVPDGTVDAYAVAEQWQDFNNIRELSSIEILYNELIDDINATNELLEATWTTIVTECPDVADEFTETHESLANELSTILQDVESTYAAGNLTEDVANSTESALEEIKQEIERLLTDAKTAESDYLHKEQLYEETVAEVEATNKSLSDAWTTITSECPDMVGDLQTTHDAISGEIASVKTELNEAYEAGELNDEIVDEIQEQLATIEQEIEDMLNYASEYTAIVDITTNGNAEAVGYYTADGKLIPTLQHGVNVIRYSDGTVKKVLVK